MANTSKAHGPCEIRTLLAGVLAWEKCKRDLGGEWETWEKHHAFRMRHLLDDERFVLTLCQPAHRFIHQVWEQAGTLVCIESLRRSGRLDLPAVTEQQKCPLFKIENWLKDGLFWRDTGRNAGVEPLLMQYAFDILQSHGREWPKGVPAPSDVAIAYRTSHQWLDECTQPTELRVYPPPSAIADDASRQPRT